MFSRPRRWRLSKGEAILAVLLIAQLVMTFVAIPLSVSHRAGRVLLDAGHVTFAALCALALTERRGVQAALLTALVVLSAGPALLGSGGLGLDLPKDVAHQVIAVTAFGFNLMITLLVARRSFGPGQVTAYRIQGAVLVYFNVAALFAIAYDLLETHLAGSIRPSLGGVLPIAPAARTAELSYFSLATITTTGYGDLAPAHPAARSLAMLEAAFGQIFPAIFVARLVALHLVHSGGAGDGRTPPD